MPEEQDDTALRKAELKKHVEDVLFNDAPSERHAADKKSIRVSSLCERVWEKLDCLIKRDRDEGLTRPRNLDEEDQSLVSEIVQDLLLEGKLYLDLQSDGLKHASIKPRKS